MRVTEATVISSWAVAAVVALRSSATALPDVSAWTTSDVPSFPPAIRVPAVVVNVTLRLSPSVCGSSSAVIVAREIPSAGSVVVESVTLSTLSAWLGPTA